MSLLTKQHIHLVGIKGVAMTSLAEMLTDAGCTITGSDVAEHFVTEPTLEKLSCLIQTGFADPVPRSTEVVVYTAAHGGKFNPQVVAATEAGIPVLSHAEALAELANSKKTIAVCGVGGKSTTSAMLAWIFEALDLNPSYSVGVGSIPGLDSPGRWEAESQYCIVEADEYVTDLSAPKRGETITPRFSFLHPFCTICTKIAFDHPDVYQDFDHTLATYNTFFNQVHPDGLLIYHSEQKNLPITTTAGTVLTFGPADADITYEHHPQPGHNEATITIQATKYHLTLQIPGKHNIENATAAVGVCHFLGLDVQAAVNALATFRSTQRRFEYKGEVAGVTYYDDYAHHPREISATVAAFAEWMPDTNRVVAFQPHTFSRTKELFPEFVTSFAAADTILLLDIFASARESFDSSISSDDLAAAIKKTYPHKTVVNLHSVAALAQYCSELPPKTAVITLGAGDIYQVHDTIHQSTAHA